ncbi:MAG: penicillin-binding protein 2 [Motilibacteraceae bacterium]
MSERSRLRLVVLQVLVVSLLVTLFGRLWFLQVASGEKYQAAATSNRIREIVTPAPRGLILDDRGRPLARNRTALVVSVSRTELLQQKDGGKALLHRVAKVIDEPFQTLWDKTRLCGEPGAPKPPTCWNGSPYQPIPLTEEAEPKMALQIMERREDFPGVSAELQAVREYPQPMGANAAHELGYLGPVTQGELDAQKAKGGTTLQRNDVVGRSGLEAEYDSELRGAPGVEKLAVDQRGAVTGVVGATDPTPGNYVVTNIDAGVQAVAEQQLWAAIQRARTTGDLNKGGKKFTADSGSVVVLDVKTGGVVAMASYPTYDPNVWVGGISQKNYDAISSETNLYPNQSRAFQGEFAPGSTFKVVTLPGAVQSGYYPLDQTYPCTSSYRIGDSLKSNYESEAFGNITLKKALEVSCDTIFYKFAYEQWLRDGGNTPVKNPKDPMFKSARGYLLGQKTGIDLPGEVSGRIPDRQWKQDYWEATRDYYCTAAKTGFPNTRKTDPAKADFLTKLSKENCTEGNRFRGGDVANFAIGQGDLLVSPLQMAMVYASIANGGTIYEPHVAKAIVKPDGTVVKNIDPVVRGKIPVQPKVLAYMKDALRGVTDEGTGHYPFVRVNFPLDKIPVASKTGTAEVYGKESTSWFASYAPATDPQYAIVMMVTQGGTGSGVSGPSVATIYKKLFGVQDDGSIDPSKAVVPDGKPATKLPAIAPDGTVVLPKGTTFGAQPNGLPVVGGVGKEARPPKSLPLDVVIPSVAKAAYWQPAAALPGSIPAGPESPTASGPVSGLPPADPPPHLVLAAAGPPLNRSRWPV